MKVRKLTILAPSRVCDVSDNFTVIVKIYEVNHFLQQLLQSLAHSIGG